MWHEFGHPIQCETLCHLVFGSADLMYFCFSQTKAINVSCLELDWSSKRNGRQYFISFAALQMNVRNIWESNRWISLHTTMRSLTVSIKLHASLYNIDFNYLSVQIIHSIDRPKPIQTIPSIGSVLCRCEATQNTHTHTHRFDCGSFDLIRHSHRMRGEVIAVKCPQWILLFLFFSLFFSFHLKTFATHTCGRTQSRRASCTWWLALDGGRVAWIESF